MYLHSTFGCFPKYEIQPPRRPATISQGCHLWPPEASVQRAPNTYHMEVDLCTRVVVVMISSKLSWGPTLLRIPLSVKEYPTKKNGTSGLRTVNRNMLSSNPKAYFHAPVFWSLLSQRPSGKEDAAFCRALGSGAAAVSSDFVSSLEEFARMLAAVLRSCARV